MPIARSQLSYFPFAIIGTLNTNRTLDKGDRTVIVTDPTIKGFLESLKTTPLQQGSSSHTILAYRGDLQKFVEHLLANYSDSPIDWSAITTETVEDFVQTLETRGLAASTINRYIASINSFFRWAVSDSKVVSNPAKRGDVKRRRITPVKNPTLTHQQVAALFRACNSNPNSALANRDQIIYRLALYGLTVSQILEIQIDEIDFESKQLKRGDSAYSITLDGRLCDLIFQYIWNVHTGSDQIVESDPLILNKHGFPLTRQGAHVVLKKDLRAAGLPSAISLGTLRDTFVKNSQMSDHELHVRLAISIKAVHELQRRIAATSLV